MKSSSFIVMILLGIQCLCQTQDNTEFLTRKFVLVAVRDMRLASDFPTGNLLYLPVVEFEAGKKIGCRISFRNANHSICKNSNSSECVVKAGRSIVFNGFSSEGFFGGVQPDGGFDIVTTTRMKELVSGNQIEFGYDDFSRKLWKG